MVFKEMTGQFTLLEGKNWLSFDLLPRRPFSLIVRNERNKNSCVSKSQTGLFCFLP